MQWFFFWTKIYCVVIKRRPPSYLSLFVIIQNTPPTGFKGLKKIESYQNAKKKNVRSRFFYL